MGSVGSVTVVAVVVSRDVRKMKMKMIMKLFVPGRACV